MDLVRLLHKRECESVIAVNQSGEEPVRRRHVPMTRGITREQLERVARIYHSNEDAGRALGIVGRSFSRLCRHNGIETPYARRRRERDAARHNQTKREAA